MTSQFSQEVLRACVGHVCQAIGYQGIYATPLGVLTDLLHRYLSELCRLTHRYTEHCESPGAARLPTLGPGGAGAEVGPGCPWVA